MRITNNMLINNMLNYIGNNLGRMELYQHQLATGKKISVPSDDPVVAARALRLRTDVAEVQQFKRNTDDAASWMEITESAMSDLTDIMQRIRELTVDGSNGTKTPDDMQKIASEVQQMKEQTINLANSTYAGRYIFSGFKTDEKLMTDEGIFNINVANSEYLEYEIGIGDDIAINVPGGELFNNGVDAVGTASATNGKALGDFSINFPLEITAPDNTFSITVDGEAVTATITPDTYNDISEIASEVQDRVNDATTAAADITVAAKGSRLEFTSGSTGSTSSITIDGSSPAAVKLGLVTTTQANGLDATVGQKGRLMQDFDDLITALNDGDHSAVTAMLVNIDEDISNLLRIRSDIGARTNRLDLTANRLETDTINYTKLMSQNEDVDMAQTIMNLKNEENVYRASLSGGARIIMPTLMDFLR